MKKMFVALALFVSVPALAGLYLPTPVDVDLVDNRATGDMWSARFSDSSDSFIGCGFAVDDVAGQFAFCQAQDADGDFTFCSANDSEIADAIKSITPWSEVTFRWDPVTFECTFINISTQSYFLRRMRRD